MGKALQEGLAHRVVRGGFWIFLLRILERLLYAARLIILARILGPHDFGLIGLALLMLSVLKTFFKTGFQTALIQQKGDIKSYLDVGWTISVLRGIFLFAVLYAAAPFLSSFFNSPQSLWIIRVIGVSLLLQSLVNMGVIYFQKELEFNKQFVYQASGTFADFIVAVGAAVILKSVWALVLGIIARDMVRLITSYIIHPHRPRISFHVGQAGKLISFGKWVVTSNILLFLITEGDDIFVGKFLGLTALGFYQIAYRVSNMPITELTHVISQATFPAYAKLQKDIARLRAAYLRALQFAAFISFPIAGIIFVFCDIGTQVILGAKWMPMVPAIRVLCLFAIARSIGTTYGPLFYGTNNPRLLTVTTLIKLTMLLIIIYPLTLWFGITGTALATTLPIFVSQPYGISRVKRIIQSSYTDILVPVVIPFLATLCMSAVFLSIKRIAPESIFYLLINLASGVLVYMLFIVLASRQVGQYGIINELKTMLGSVIKRS